MFTMTLIVRFVSALALQPPSPQGEFVPATGAATEHLPAAPLLIAAYAFVWAATVFYLWTIWRRLDKVETDLHRIAERQPHRQVQSPGPVPGQRPGGER